MSHSHIIQDSLVYQRRKNIGNGKNHTRKNQLLITQKINGVKHAKNTIFVIVLTLLLTVIFFSPNSVSALGSSDLLFPCDILFPQADSFSDLEGEPLHYKVFENQNGNNTLVGICYTVSSRGYSDDILIMVGLNNDHTITGMRVLEQKEAIVRTIGNFMREQFFYNQYNDKDVDDDFKVGRDIDSVTRATITNKYISTAIQDSSRQIDQIYFESKDTEFLSSEQMALRKTILDNLKDDGGIVDIDVKDKNGFVGLSLDFVYVNPPMIGKSILGAAIYDKTMLRYGDEQVFLVGVNSDFGHNFGPQNVQIVQGENMTTLRFTSSNYYQDLDNGLSADYYIVMPLEEKINFSKPDIVTINYVTKSETFSTEYDIPDKYFIIEDPHRFLHYKMINYL